jgi:hypothetical protein
VAQDSPDPVIENLKRCLVPPGVDEDAYIQSSVSPDVTMGPLVLSQNTPASGVSALESSMDIQHDGVFVRSEPETDLGCGFDATHRTVTESISQLFYVVAFSRLSCPRRTSPPAVPDSSCSGTHHTPSTGETDLPASCVDDSSSEPPNSSSLSKESVSVTFTRPVSPLPPSSPGFVGDYSMEYSDYEPVPQFPSQSSPVPSSSPPNVFTSSPSRRAIDKSPPTSPGPAEKLMVVPSSVNSNPLKRPHSPETATTPADDHNEDSGEQTAKKKARYARNTRIYDTYCL